MLLHIPVKVGRMGHQFPKKITENSLGIAEKIFIRTANWQETSGLLCQEQFLRVFNKKQRVALCLFTFDYLK